MYYNIKFQSTLTYHKYCFMKYNVKSCSEKTTQLYMISIQASILTTT